MKNLATPLELAGLGSRPQTERSDALSFDWRIASIGLSVALAYYLGAKIGFALTFRPHPVSVLWPPNSILLAALLLTPVRVWWVILLAAFPAHLTVQLQSNVPPMMILCWFISNACEALIGAGCVRYLIDRPVRFDRLRNVGIFDLGSGPVRVTWRQRGHLRFDASCDLERGTRVWAIFDKVRRRKCAFDSNVFDRHVGPASASGRCYRRAQQRGDDTPGARRAHQPRRRIGEFGVLVDQFRAEGVVDERQRPCDFQLWPGRAFVSRTISLAGASGGPKCRR